MADNATGQVLAHVGSPDYFDGRRAGQVDMTQALRSPGSTLKPFIYGLGFEDGFIHPETLIEDRPVSYGAYTPKDFDFSFQGHGDGTRGVAVLAQCARPSPCLIRSDPAGSPRGWRRPAPRSCCPRAKRPVLPSVSAASA